MIELSKCRSSHIVLELLAQARLNLSPSVISVTFVTLAECKIAQ